jgi:hypothetical protein
MSPIGGEIPEIRYILIQCALHTIQTGRDEVGLSVNPGKTVLVVFTRRRKLPSFFEPHFYGFTSRRYM